MVEDRDGFRHKTWQRFILKVKLKRQKAKEGCFIVALSFDF